MAIKKRYSAQIVVLAKETMRERLERLADERDASISAVIREALEIGLAKIDPDHEEAGGDKRSRAA